MKIINGKYYFSPMEASMLLGVSYKTLQRWAGARGIPVKKKNSGRRTVLKKIKLAYVKTFTGHRYYKKEHIEKLAAKLVKVHKVELTTN